VFKVQELARKQPLKPQKEAAEQIKHPAQTYPHATFSPPEARFRVIHVPAAPFSLLLPAETYVPTNDFIVYIEWG
jgi:hypothetical protein